MSEIQIQAEITPNPNTLKFLVSREITERCFDFVCIEEAHQLSPIAVKLFMIPEISGVYLGKNFITVTKNSSRSWDELQDDVLETIRSHLEEEEPVVLERKKIVETKELGDVEKRVIQILEDEIRPAVAMDGGDVEFKGYKDGLVYLQMKGACCGCPSASITLKMGIEARLKEAIPEVKEVIGV